MVETNNAEFYEPYKDFYKNFQDSPLVRSATITLLATADEQQLRLGAMDSIISQYLIVDLLISLLAGNDRKKRKKESFQYLNRLLPPILAV